MENRFRVVMLPTEKESNIVKFDNGKIVQIKTKKDKFFATSQFCEYQHLYIVDTEATIEAGDYCFDGKHMFGPFEKSDIPVKKFEKIIASTDTSLGLPAIPNHFIKAYCLDQNTIIENVEIVDGIANVNWVVDSPGKTEIVLDDIFPDEESDSPDKKDKSFEEQALEWWNNLSPMEQGRFTIAETGNAFENLSKKEIVLIWLKETGQINYQISDTEYVLNTSIPDKLQVDFELLSQGIESISCFVRLSDEERANMLQFFEYMKDPSFAQKASKWFQNH